MSARTFSIIALAACAASGARADDPLDPLGLGQWSFGGTLTGQVEVRGGSGDPAAQVFGPDDTDAFGEFDLRASRAFTPFHIWEGSVFGVVNGSDFRGTEHGLSVERLRITGQRGDVDVPWRVEAGDYFASTSERTLQRPLKGARVEVQPAFGDPAFFHSVQAFAGNTAQDYDRFLGDQADGEVHAGLSWLVEHETWGALMLSGAWSRLGATEEDGLTLAIAGETGFDLGSHRLRAEGEVAFFDGDRPAAGGDSGGLALFATLGGEGDGWRYSARMEDYDGGFRPPGAAIIPDQRFLEGRLGYTFADNTQAELRLQDQITARSGGNPLTVRTAGLFMTLPPGAATWDTGLTLDASYRTEETRDRLTDRETLSGDLIATRTLGADWTGTLRLSAITTDESGTGGAADRDLVQADIDATRRIDLAGGFSGAVTPGLTLRWERTGTDDVSALGPRLALFLADGTGHSLSARAGLLVQSGDAAAADSLEVNTALSYSYTTGPHRFGAEADYFSRDPDPGASGDAYRVALSYSYTFDRPAAAAPVAGFGPSAGARIVSGGFTDLTAFTLGAGLAEARAALEAEGRTAPFRIGPLLVAEDRWLAEIDTRQRLVLEEGLGRLTRAGLVIDLPQGGSGAADARILARVEDAFLRAYGPPATTIREGDFGAGIAADLREGRFRRFMEWPVAGGVLRLGIPARQDGLVRIEAIHARTQPPPARLVWGLDSLR